MDLENVAGQASIVKIIKNSLKLDRVSHAYLFCGPRGTGKTTMAKILAKNVNCLDLHDGEACGKCKNCLAILNGNCPDIIEIDAASNNSVDEIREIKNKISLVPSELKYKVYIIDEVHMLSIGAFNALLKTLEEPPEHVIFILATTDLHKVPVTVVSRCQCLDFHRIRENEIVRRLETIVNNENIKVDAEVLNSIANLSDGGLRDAIGMLDKVVSYSDSIVSIEDFEELNGIVSIERKKEFLKIIESSNIKEFIEFTDDIYNKGKDLAIFCQDLMILCRNLIVDYYTYQKCDFDVDFLLQFVDKLNDLCTAIRDSSNVRITFETKILSFLRSLNQKSTVPVEKTVLNTNIKEDKGYLDSQKDMNSLENFKNIVEKVSLEVAVEEKEPEKVEEVVNYNSSDNLAQNMERNSIIVNNCFFGASKNDLNTVKSMWNRLNDFALDSQLGAAACYLSDAVVRAASDKAIILTFDYESVVTRAFGMHDPISKVIEKILNHKYDVAYLTSEQWEKERAKYIENKNQGIPYVYRDLSELESPPQNIDVISQEKERTEESITDEAIKLFGENIVSINEGGI